MNVSLTPELERLVQDKVASGMYQTASEVIRDALRLLEEQDFLRQRRIEQLRKEIQIGLDQLERGEWVDGEEAFAALRKRSIEMRKQRA